MKNWDKIKKHINPTSIPETEFGMPEVTFFIKALEASPVGSTLYLEQYEPEDWTTRLIAWSFKRSLWLFTKPENNTVGIT